MPRTKKTPASARQVTIPQLAGEAQPVGQTKGGVEVVALDSATLVTFDDKWDGWAKRSAFTLPPGAFVRLRPPAYVEDEQIEAMRDTCIRLGATVQIERAQRSDVVPGAARPEAAKGEAPHRRAREVVEEMVEEASGDRDALRELVVKINGEVGL